MGDARGGFMLEGVHCNKDIVSQSRRDYLEKRQGSVYEIDIFHVTGKGA